MENQTLTSELNYEDTRQLIQKLVNKYKNISDKSKTEYINLFDSLCRTKDGKERFKKNEDIIKRATDTCKKNTWNKRRAAIRYCCIQALNQIICEYEELSKSDFGKNQIEKVWLLQQINAHVNLLKSIPNGCPIPEDKIVKRKSKLSDMRKLDENWRELVYENADDKYKLPILIMGVAGVRPAELQKKIQIRIDHQLLVITIMGAKVRDGLIRAVGSNHQVKYKAGQEWRKLTFKISPENRLVNELADIVKNSKSEVFEPPLLQNTASLTSAVRAISNKIFPKRKKPLTAYCFRHSFASDVKRSNLGDEDKSKCMSHASAKTRQRYGRSVCSKSSATAPIKVEAPNPVRHLNLSYDTAQKVIVRNRPDV